MEIKRGELQIARMPTTEGGAKIEPEQQAARHVLDVVPGPITHGTEPLTGALAEKARNYPMQVLYDGLNAGGVAQSLKSKCSFCKFFDQEAMLRFLKRNEFGSDPEKRQLLQAIRMHLEVTSGEEDGISDDELHFLAAMGVCRAMSEIKHDTMLVHKDSGCPEETYKGEDLSKLFQPRNNAAQRDSTSIYDAVLQMAQGKKR